MTSKYVCPKCSGSGFILKKGRTVLCSCQRAYQFRQYLLDRGFRLELIEPWLTLISPIKSQLNPLKGTPASAFIKGEKAGTLFYSFMSEQLRHNKATMIVSSSKITEIFMSSKDRKALSCRNIGVVLGFDLTNNIQGKVMADFIFFRQGLLYATTTFWLPYNSMRRLETEYGEVFSSAFKNETIKLLEVK